MSTEGIQSALQQMQSLATQASTAPRLDRSETAQGGFASEFQASIERINALQQTARTQSMDFQAGKPGVALNDVVVDMQKSSVAFEMGVQVRNKLVSAYRDIMNMQV